MPSRSLAAARRVNGLVITVEPAIQAPEIVSSASLVPQLRRAKWARYMRLSMPFPPLSGFRVVNGYKRPMAVMLICPKCRGDTELRGTMDAYYLTWCPECERLWRLELWTLMH